LWRSLKYECVFLSAFETGSEARSGIGRWIGYYNTSRPHSTFGGRPHVAEALVERHQLRSDDVLRVCSSVEMRYRTCVMQIRPA
jgi:hypothetical protein